MCDAKHHAIRILNKWEERHALWLDSQIKAGLIRWVNYEPLKLRLADKTYYTPDFIVVTKTGRVEAHEVKGHWRDDARVKIKVAAEHFRWITFRVFGQEGEIESWNP